MRRRVAGVLIVLVVIGIGGLFARPASASLLALNLRELTERARVILIGRVEQLHSVEVGPRGAIYTYVTVAVERYVKGQRLASKAVMRIPGGYVDGLGLWVSDMPEFAVGQEVLLFLEGEAELEPVAGVQGKYTVRDGVLVENGRPLSEVLQLIESILGAENGKLAAANLEMAPIAPPRSSSALNFLYSGWKWFGEHPMNEPYYIYENTADCTGEGAAIQAAAQTWSSVNGADFKFVYGGPTTRDAGPDIGMDGYNVIRWYHTGKSALATAYIWYSDTEGILETDLIFNDDYPWSASEVPAPGTFDVQNLATHELGHWLYLRDLYGSEDVEKTMYGYAGLGETKKRTLHDDDIAGIRYIYPAPLQPVPRVIPSEGWSTPDALQFFTAVYTHTQSWRDIRYADFLINANPTITYSVYARYDVQANKMYLYQPAGLGWLGGKTPGVPGTISHVYGMLDAGQSAVVTSAKAITVTWALNFTWRTSGKAYNMYLSTQDVSEAVEPWGDYGDWVINRMPNWLVPPSLANQVVNVGTRYTFDPRYRDLDGWQNLDELYFLISDSYPGGAVRNSVYLKYDQSENRMYIRDLNDTMWLPSGGVEPGTNVVLENDLVKVIVTWSNVGIYDAKTRIVRWRLEFKPAFKGKHTIYMRARDLFADYNGDTGWKWKGTLEVQ